MLFVKEIVIMQAMPDHCPTCERDDRLEEDAIIERRSGGRTVLCKRCEALVVVTSQNLGSVDLLSSGDDVMLKEPHLIRRVF